MGLLCVSEVVCPSLVARRLKYWNIDVRKSSNAKGSALPNCKAREFVSGIHRYRAGPVCEIKPIRGEDGGLNRTFWEVSRDALSTALQVLSYQNFRRTFYRMRSEVMGIWDGWGGIHHIHSHFRVCPQVLWDEVPNDREREVSERRRL